MWSSSLTDSVSRAKPDNQSVDYSTRIQGVNSILAATTKPMLFDIDNGGRIEHLRFILKDLERVGVSGIVIEDKIGLKKNSLFENQKDVKQDSISNFCKKIKVAKDIIHNKDFLIIARVESLILGKKLKDAIIRAEAYSRAGADAILIHSKKTDPEEIINFARVFRKSKFYKPMVAVPSTYSKVYEKQLIIEGFKVIIYANHLLRASYAAMLKVAKKILSNKRSFEAEKSITPIKDIISLT
jgi:phosphoenolpyruvate phosphomutase